MKFLAISILSLGLIVISTHAPGTFQLKIGFAQAWARKDQKITLEKPLKADLNRALKATIEFHQATQTGEDGKVKAALAGLINDLDRALNRATNIREGQTPLVKMLEAAISHLRAAQMANEESYIRNLKEGMGQLVQIHRVYDLDTYQVFFCSRDQSVWLQKERKAFNPIHPKVHKDCGKSVR